MSMKMVQSLERISMALCLTNVLFFACRDGGTEPSPSLQPGKRNFVWIVDTLSYPGSSQTIMRSIWASSSQDVYVVGHNDQNRGQMFHFDGRSWGSVRLAKSEGGTILGAFDLSAIYGFGKDDIYAVGEGIYLNSTPPPDILDSSLIIRYDRLQWQMIHTVEGRQLTSVWGNSSGHILAGGILGSLIRCDGSTCVRTAAGTNFWFLNFSQLGSGIYALAYTPSGFTANHVTINYFMKWNGSTFSPIDSFSEVNQEAVHFGHLDIMNIGGKLYTAGYGVFMGDGTQWTQTLWTNQTMNALFGTRKEHIFSVGSNRTVYHFNGTDWESLKVPGSPDWQLSRVWCDESEVFIVAVDGSKSFIIHGM